MGRVLSNKGRWNVECKISCVGRCRLLVLEVILLVLSLDEGVLSGEFQQVSKGFEDTPARGLLGLAMPETVTGRCLMESRMLCNPLVAAIVRCGAWE